MTPLVPIVAPFSYGTFIVAFHQVAKDVALGFLLLAATLGIPLGVYQLLMLNYASGALIMIGSVAIFPIAFMTCEYYTRQDVHNSFWGFVVAVATSLLGFYALYGHGLSVPLVFLKLYIIGLIVVLHGNTDKSTKTTPWKQSAFWAQKAMIFTGIVLVAFIHTEWVFLMGGALVIIFYAASLGFYLKYNEWETSIEDDESGKKNAAAPEVPKS